MREVVDGKPYDVAEAELLCRVLGGPTIVPSMNETITLVENVYRSHEGDHFVVEVQTQHPHERGIPCTVVRRLKPLTEQKVRRYQSEAKRQVAFGQ